MPNLLQYPGLAGLGGAGGVPGMNSGLPGMNMPGFPQMGMP